MASTLALSSVVIFVLLAAFTSGASAAIFSIRNNCRYTVWPAAIPVGGGLRLNPGQTWTLDVPAGTKPGRIWGRTGCSFSGGEIGYCETGDCAGALSCTVSGQPPTTLAEFAIGGGSSARDRDYYAISVIDGYNLAMDFSCSTGVTLQCRDPNCLQEYHGPVKTPSCKGNSNYQVIFCP